MVRLLGLMVRSAHHEQEERGNSREKETGRTDVVFRA